MADTETDVVPTDIANTDIALVGMAGRFPGARDVAGLWAALRAGRRGITTFGDEELRAAGVSEAQLADPAYVKAGAVIDGIDQFDAAFFGVNPKEAAVLDPQHRLFLEHSWIALEDAGCDPARFDGSVGVFAGSAWSTYLTSNLNPAGAARDVGDLTVALGNEKDCMPLRVAHHLGLSGPALAVQSNCSTSLVAVCLAASSLASFECDMALAGGVSLSVPHRVGYYYQQGGITPPDGVCRPFDGAGLGAPLGGGVAVVALRRLADALADGDRVYAVLRGWAVNNDAGRKAGFTAPSTDGQASVIAEALAAAGLDPADIDYVEAHGTGTALGDAAEIAALQRVFDGEAVRVGSVKSNIGHLDRAAGVTGLIKTALSLYHREIPATVNLREPNPQLTSGQARLSVVTENQSWPSADRTRRAGVSAFGIGGTNAHVVLEEAPTAPRPPADGRPAVLIWSARSAGAADQATADLARHLDETDSPLADIANTLQRGRAEFAHRRMVVADSPAAAAAALRGGAAAASARVHARQAGFLISAVPVAGPAEALYGDEPAFLAALARCREAQAGLPAAAAGDPRLAVFTARYALAELARARGIEPSLLLGHGLAELVAGCLAGVLSLSDALALAAGAGTGGPIQTGVPSVPLLSAATGLPLTPEQAADPAYWAGAATADTGTAALAAAAAGLLADGTTVLLEIGPAGLLETAARDAAVAGGLLVPSNETTFAELAGRLWLAGVPVDWAAFHGGQPLGKVALPTAPFQRQRYWIDPPARPGTATDDSATGAADDPGSRVRLLAQRWQPTEPEPDGQGPAAGRRYVIVPDDQGIGDELARLLRDRGATAVTAGDDRTLTAALSAASSTRPCVVHLRGLAAADAESAVLDSARVLTASAATGAGQVSVCVVTRGGQAVGRARPVRPDQAAVAVLPVVAAQEHPNLRTRSVDLDPAYSPAQAAAALAAELTGPEAPQVAFRGSHRYQPAYAALPPQPRADAPVRAGGRYLITGGLGPVGLILAGYLAEAGAGAIVLTSRRRPDDPGDPRMTALSELRAHGAAVTVEQADVTDLPAMRRILRSGRFDGIVHAAADTGAATFRPLAGLDAAVTERHFQAKAGGARVLARLLDELPPEQAPRWCVLFSSTAALLGGLTLGSYGAANAALAALAHGRPAGGPRWIAACWDTWPGTLDRVTGPMGGAMAAHAMSRSEAVAAFAALFAQDEPSVIVAAGGLDGRLPVPAPAAELASASPAVEARAPRPDLPQPYVAAASATERALAEIWTTVLGIGPVGTRDNFFDLSGNSLLALQMLALVQERLGVALPTVTLFEAPTVHALASAVDALAAGPSAPAPAPELAAPPEAGTGSARRYQVLPVSGPDSEAADEAVARLAAHLSQQPELGQPDTALADVARTLQTDREAFGHRRVVTAAGRAAAVAALSGTADGAGPARAESSPGRQAAFVLAGVGEQYPGIVGQLYRREPAFRDRLNECLTLLAQAPALPRTPAGGVWSPDGLAGLITGEHEGAPGLAALLGRADAPARTGRAEQLRRTELAQPLMFSIDYALAGTLREWGVQPALMFGYSLGEYAAACLAGVLSLPDAIALVCYRAALIGEAEPGRMAAVPLGEPELRARFDLDALGLDVAAVNGPAASVVAGPEAAVEALTERLREAGRPGRMLDTTHAFHSRMLAPLQERLSAWIARNVELRPPTLPYLSNVTGGLAGADLACDPGYWARHMCAPVQFAAAAATLLADERRAVVEIGPGQSLGALLRGCGGPPQRWPLITATLPGAAESRADDAALADCLARLWLGGVDIDWGAYQGQPAAPAETGADAAAQGEARRSGRHAAARRRRQLRGMASEPSDR